MTVEKAKKYLNNFAKLDYTKDKNRYKLLEQFVNKVFVYDEYCVVIYNGTNSVGEEFDLNDKEIKSQLNFGNKKTESEILFGFGSLGSPKLYDPIKILESTQFAKFNYGKYKASKYNSQEILTKQQKLWGIFTTLIEIEKQKLCELRFVKLCSLEKAEV